MLCYVILCVAIYFIVVKFWSKKQKTINRKVKNKHSIIHEELEEEENIFNRKQIGNKNISEFEINNPYNNRTADEFLN